MKRSTITLSILILFVFTNVRASAYDDSKKEYFNLAKQELENMLSGKSSASFEKAIYIIENAWCENTLKEEAFNKALDLHTTIIKDVISTNRKNPSSYVKESLLTSKEDQQKEYEKVLTNYAIYSFIKDTTAIRGSREIFIHPPYNYSFNDPFGTEDWTNTQVSNLIAKGEGNCFALASLFKILSERLNSDATLCTAPGHIYIRHADEKGTYYNVELSNNVFPGTGTIETLTYTTNEATKNNISLRELDLKQSIALCLVYLAKGYEHKFGIKNDKFIEQCADAALQYDQLSLNALLLKSEILENRIINKNKTLHQLQSAQDFKEYEKLISYLYRLGYREMPLEMKNILVKGWRREKVEGYMKDNRPKAISRYASLSWGAFDEFHEYKPIEKYGRTLFDTKAGKIKGFEKEDVLYNQYNFDPVVFALSIDPLAEKYPNISPYAFCYNNPINFVDKDGREGVAVINEQNKTVTIKAVYYVQTIKAFDKDPMIGYNTKQIESMNTLDDFLNKKGYKVSEGDYAGYSVNFDFQFKDGGTLDQARELMKSEEVGGHPTGNSFTKGNGSVIGYFLPRELPDGRVSYVGGVTADHKEITMNSRADDKRNRIHEMFHTLFFDNDDAQRGIGSYQNREMPNQADINMLINNEKLPKVDQGPNAYEIQR